MLKASLYRIEPEHHSYSSERVYTGNLWSVPAPTESCILYQNREELKKFRPKLEREQGDLLFKYDEYIPVIRTSIIKEIFYTGPKVCYFKTNNSIYKLEVLDEDFRFNKPYVLDVFSN